MKKILFAILLSAITAGGALAAGTEISEKFRDAFRKDSSIKMTAIVKENVAFIPDEIKAIIESAAAPGLPTAQKEFEFEMADMMARYYYDITADPGPVKIVKKKYLDSSLSPAVRLTSITNIHMIEVPNSKGHATNAIKPNNIIIPKGDTVRWVNNDIIAHVFASIPQIGMGGIFSPKIEPGQKWEYEFTKPGEYYYMSLNMKGMVGKITVE